MKLVGVAFYKVKSRLYGLELDDYKDMLRYDLGFVNPDLPNIVAFPMFKTPFGNLGGTVTTNRWRSFSIIIEPVSDDNQHTLVYDAFLRSGKWSTYQHPDVKEAAAGYRTNYGELREIPLNRYLEVKDHRDATKVEKGS